VAFRYLKDPLFLVCFSAYCVHRVLKTHDLSTPLLCSYLNDVICIPFWIPIMLWGERKLGFRQHDDPPSALEIVIPLVIWAIVFEVVLPSTDTFAGLAVPDPNDVLCYALGGFVAARFWQWWYRRRDASPASAGPS
jgi:hypothetical protein